MTSTPALVELLRRLERYDTYPAGEALQAAFLENDEESAWHPGALATLWKQMIVGLQTGDPGSGWEAMTRWTDQRLTNWHSFKTNALLSAWKHDPGAPNLPAGSPEAEQAHRERCEEIVRAVVFDLRQGIAEHPELVDDAAVLQALATEGHAFIWRQAHKELLEDEEQFNLQPGDPDLMLYCWAGGRAFRYLLTQTGGDGQGS